MKKFKVNDRVFHVFKGWGTVLFNYLHYDLVEVQFDMLKENISIETSFLSFTEYTLKSFSQERDK
ncbi:MAG: hypothetical protein ACRC0V_04440 [Fusobacteriaceae bacterium]